MGIRRAWEGFEEEKSTKTDSLEWKKQRKNQGKHWKNQRKQMKGKKNKGQDLFA